MTWADLDSHIVPEFEHSALVVIDMQNDFVDGNAPIPGTAAVIGPSATLVKAFHAAGRPVVHAIRLYRGADVDRSRRTLIADGAAIVAPGSPGAQITEELTADFVMPPNVSRLLAGEIVEVAPGEVVLWKPRWSAFYRTRLHEYLTGLDVTTVVVAGCNFPNCPRATVFDASSRDYRVVVAPDAVSRFTAEHSDELAAIGVVTASAQLIAAAVSAT